MDQKQTLVNAIPTTGEIKYDDLRTALITSGNGEALEVFHAMRRKGEIAVRLENKDDAVTLFVSRVAVRG